MNAPNPEEQKLSGTEKKIEERKNRVWSLLTQGFTQQQIAKKLGVSTKTISRDYQQLKTELIRKKLLLLIQPRMLSR